MIILDQFVDLIKVIQIKMFALYAEVPFDRFEKELHFVSVVLVTLSVWHMLHNRADPLAWGSF